MRKRKNLYRCGSWGREYLGKAILCSLPDIEEAIAQERACKRPRRGLLRALETKATEFRGRLALLAEIPVGNFFGAVTPERAMRYADAADKWLMLAPEHADSTTHQFILDWLASLPAGAKVKVYSCAGACSFGLHAQLEAAA